MPPDVPPGQRYAWWAGQLADALREVIDVQGETLAEAVVHSAAARRNAAATLAAFRGWQGAGLDRLAEALGFDPNRAGVRQLIRDAAPDRAADDDDDPRWVLTDKGEAALRESAMDWLRSGS